MVIYYSFDLCNTAVRFLFACLRQFCRCLTDLAGPMRLLVDICIFEILSASGGFGGSMFEMVVY